ncbi:sigma factor-like helix-turn-helix DNA-binding protein [Demequina sediminicola]|uniref:sigma factor-like helix-turn-helix DNA-binding protein n=1 Tax=Demequina sediminicola TaxID=1095026 RepID=UPI0007802A29|nr:sigma factor-like helix-turn-helix DNA-binding protein [Demequina sediminicola]
MYVVTADQRGSKRRGDRVEELLEWSVAWSKRWSDAVALPLERTVGDEVQAVLTDPEAALDLALALMRREVWSVGLGLGNVDLPLAATSRASTGPAFVFARRAVERARGRAETVPLVVACEDMEREEHATALLQLLGAIVRKRSSAGWEVADLDVQELTQKEIAHALGISAQAVSQRKAAALVDEERRARPLAVALISTDSASPVDVSARERQDGAL